MSEKEPEVISFGFGIRVIKKPDGQEEYQTRTSNEGVSTEIVIMQLRAYLDAIEEDYFNDFKQNALRYKEE